ncbi:uncharacterized protein BKA78DRAFT_307473 [Phyllosticta capitalensis]|uniref:uncharacterized protein n=1 Tax=Phyllosticta capitalensis TaxID=121624 RepID=UPI00312F0355
MGCQGRFLAHDFLVMRALVLVMACDWSGMLLCVAWDSRLKFRELFGRDFAQTAAYRRRLRPWGLIGLFLS